jgi:hypothetical protein
MHFHNTWIFWTIAWIVAGTLAAPLVALLFDDTEEE